MSDATEPAPRSLFRLLTDRSFGSFFAARLLTAIGVWLHSIVAAIVAFDSTGLVLVVAVVSIVQFAPQIIFGPVSGSQADRGDIRQQMIVGRILCSVGSIGLAAWYFFPWTGIVAVDATVLILTSLVVGIGLTIGGPAMQSAPMRLVTRRELPTAMALNTAPLTIARIAGPAIGALATVGFGYEWAFLIAGICNVAFIVLISFVVFPPNPSTESTKHRSVREAFRYVLNDRPMLLILIGITAMGFGSEPTVTLAPPLAAVLGGGEMTVGILTSSMGIGAGVGVVVSTLCASRFRHEWSAFIGMLILAASLACCAMPLPLAATTTAFGFSGLGFILSVSSLSTLLQLRLPAHIRGRVMAFWLMGFVGSRPLGALVTGALADALNLYIAFGALAVVLIICAILCRPANLRGIGRPPQSRKV